MNELVKVYSFRRSGTNLLCGLLYRNFYSGRSMWSKVDNHPNKYFVDDEGKIGNRNKWGDLFGNHSSIPPSNTDRSIYVYRDVDSTARSYYRYLKDLGELSHLTYYEWEQRLKIKDKIKQHHNNYLKSGMYSVKMEDLIEFPLVTIHLIGNYFALDHPEEWGMLERKVGWFGKVKS